MAAPTLTWYAPDGTATALFKERDVKGRYMPVVDAQTDVIPGQPGVRLRQIRHGMRTVEVPTHWEGNQAALRATLRGLVYQLDPTRGDGRLVADDGAGTRRQLTCRYAEGLELTETYAWMQRTVLVFHAFDPYWADTADTVRTFSQGQAAAFFPIFPLRLGNSNIFADTTVVNDGQVPTWPVWTVTGPATSVKMSNLTTGTVLQVNQALAQSEALTIDTGAKTIYRGTTNLFSALVPPSYFWALIPGPNGIRIELGGATAATLVSLAYRRRWLAP